MFSRRKKSANFAYLISVLLVGSTYVQTITALNEIATLNKNPLNSSCGPLSDRFCYAQEAFNYILGGPIKPGATQWYDRIPDDQTVNEMILFAMQAGSQVLSNSENPPGDFNFLIDDWIRIQELLRDKGTDSVTWGDLKYHFMRFGTTSNVLKLIAFFLRNVPKNAQLYLINVFLADIPSPTCRASVGLFFKALGDPVKNVWALRMFDASAKPPTNVFAANTNWLGNWNSCHKVKHKAPPLSIQGRYCRAKIRVNPALLDAAGPALDGFPGNPAELAAIDMGICVPDYCGAEDVAVIVNNTLKLMTIHQLSYIRQLDGVQCEGPPEPSSSFYASVTIIAILTAIAILATLYDCFFRMILNKPFATASSIGMQNIYTMCNLSSSRPYPHATFYKSLEAYQYQFSNRLQLHGMIYTSEAEHSKVQTLRKQWSNQFIFRIHRIVMDLSAYTAILKPMSNTGAMKCLNGIRVLSMIWIIWGHTYNYLGDQTFFLLTQNSLDLLDLPKERIDVQLIINALYGVDTFFLISAMLLTLSLLRFISKKGMPSWYFWPMMYLERYLRLIPPYIMIFLLYIYVVPYIGTGPMWSARDFPMKNQDCHDYWWAYFLLVNNFVPGGKGTRCLGYFWYVSNDFQLFVIAPLLIVPLAYSASIGIFILIGVLAASSCILGFNIANTYREGQILVTLQAIWEDTYIKPYCRAGPYVIGILLGYILFKTDKRKIYIPVIYQVLAWFATIGFMLTSILLNWQNHGEGLIPMTSSEYTAYFVVSRIAWPIGISWIIFSCYKGLAPLVDSILSWRGFTFFAHISYTTYLIHPMIMVYYMFAQQSLLYGTDITLIYLFLGHLIIALIMGFLTHVIFERTFSVLVTLILPKRQK